MEIVRNLSAEQLSRSIQDPDHRKSVAHYESDAGDTGFALFSSWPSVAPMRYGQCKLYEAAIMTRCAGDQSPQEWSW